MDSRLFAVPSGQKPNPAATSRRRATPARVAMPIEDDVTTPFTPSKVARDSPILSGRQNAGKTYNAPHSWGRRATARS